MTNIKVCLSGKKSVQVENFQQASKEVRSYIDSRDMGSNQFYMGKDAGFIFSDGVKIGYVSYNGRVWNMDGTEIINLS